MNKSIRLSCLLLVVIWGCIGMATAQTITTGPLSVSSICAGTTVSVPFSTSGTFGSGNTFKVQIAPATGNTYTDIGTGTSSPLTATIPNNLNGTGYRIRVTSSNPAVNGSVSTTTLAITTTPNAPGTSNISYCQGTTASPLTATTSGGATLNWYGTNATGGTGSASAPTPPTSATGTVTYYVSQSLNGCEGPRAPLAVTVSAKPAAPVVTGTAPTYCQGETATALTATGQNLKWYDAATGGNLISNVPNTSTAGIFKFYVSQTANGCESDRAEISVEVKATPTAPTVSPVSYCAGATASPLSAVAASGGTLKWYAPNGSPLSAPPTPLTSAPGQTSYSVSQTVGGSCESPKAVITVTVNAIPSAPVATSAVAYCQNETATALVATGQNLKWYEAATGGTGVNSITPDTKATGSKTYYVSQTVNGCEGPRTAVAVTVKALPAAPSVAQTTLSYCQREPTSALTATAATGGTLVWAGPGVTNPANAPTPNSSNAGTFEYSVRQRIDGCLSDEVKITVTIKEKPQAPTTEALIACVGAPAGDLEQNVTKLNNATLTWYTAATGGTGSPTAPSPTTTSARTISYYVTQTVNGCTSDRAKLDVIVNPLPAKPTIASAGPYCQGETATALKATGTAIQWYDSKGKISAAPVPSTAQDGTQYFLATQTVNGCEGPKDSIVITVKKKPVKPTVPDPSIEFCQNTKAPQLTATFEPSSTPLWTGPTSTTSATAPTIPNTVARTYTYTVTQTVNGCTSDKTEINVTVNPTPVAPTVTINRPEVCQKENPVVLTANGENLKWYSGTDSTKVITSTSQNTDNAGTFVFYVSQTIKSCEGPKARTQIRVKPLPAAPQVTSKSEICQDAPLETLKADGQAIKWFNQDDQLLGEAPRPSTNVEQETTYTFKTSQTVDGCESDKRTFTYKVNVTVRPSVVSPVVYCQNATAKPLEASGQNLKWINPYGQESSTAPIPPTANVSTKPEGDSYYVTQKASNGCESRRAEIRLIVNAPPTAKIEGTATVNLGKTVPVTITFTSVPPFSYTVSDGTSGTSETMQKEINLLPTKKSTIYTITNVSNSCGAGTPVGTFTVNTIIPTVTTNPLSVTTVCVGTNIQVPFTTAGEFMPGNAFKIELATVADTAFANKIEFETRATQSPITAPIPTTLAQGLYRVRVTATNPQVPVPGSSSPTILNIRALPTMALTGTKDIYDNESTPLSFAFTGDGPWTFEYADDQKATKVTTSTNPHIVIVTPARSTTYTANSVSNTCGVGKASGTAVIRVLPVLGLEPDPLSTVVQVYPIPTESVLTVDIDLPLQKEPALLLLTDQSGRVTKKLTTRESKTKLDLSQQAAGYYFLQIQIGDRKTVRKLMKQ